jgi:hypothetical protein
MTTCEDTVHAESRALAALAHRLLTGLVFPALAPFLAEWPQHLPARPRIAASLPVLRWLPVLAAEAADAGSAALVFALTAAAAALEWRQTYTKADLGEKFLQNYGWSELFGLHGPLVSERLACGFLLLGPQTHYPRHRHAAEEIYLPLRGAAAWQQGDGLWRDRCGGTPIHHASFEPHAMRTAGAPLLALYLWRGAELSQSARLDA